MSLAGGGPAPAGPSGRHTPLSSLRREIQRLKALAIEKDPANTLLGELLSEVVLANAELGAQVAKFGWQPDSGFTRTVDLHGLASALQKYKYERLGQLGSGAYGVVYKARNRETEELIAIKKLRYSFDESGFPDSTIREISTLKELKHDNIVQ